MHYFLQYLVLQYLEPFIRNVHWLLKSSTEALVNTVDDIYFNMRMFQMSIFCNIHWHTESYKLQIEMLCH